MWAAAFFSQFSAPGVGYSLSAEGPLGRFMYRDQFRYDGSFYVYLWWRDRP